MSRQAQAAARASRYPTVVATSVPVTRSATSPGDGHASMSSASGTGSPMRILFALPGFHRVQRGAEVALESVATHIGSLGHDEVTLLGSGRTDPARPYRFVRAPVVPRERFEKWPKRPFMRTEYMYEDATFVPGLLKAYRPSEYDVTVTCSFPYVHWALGRPARRSPRHVFVTQNGDWPAVSNRGEARFFSCDGLICTNPEYFERNREKWYSTLVPNGVDTTRFHPGPTDRARFELPGDAPIVLMVSALTESKRVAEAIRAVAKIPGTHLVVAGDGPQRAELDDLAHELMPGRFARRQLQFTDMPDLYRCADVFLHTTLLESFGNVYIEALASGLPIVAHDSVVTQWILGAHAQLVDTTDAGVLVETLQHALAEATTDLDARVEMANARYAWPVVGDAYRAFLHAVLQRDPRSPRLSP